MLTKPIQLKTTSVTGAYLLIKDYFTQPGASLAYEHEGSQFCSYRTSGGKACAVGCLVSDSDYRKEMEGKLIRRLVEIGVLDAMPFPLLKFLEGVQAAHDKAESVEDFLERLDERYMLAQEEGI